MGTYTPPRREHMTNPTTDPAAYTDQELKQALARVLALARSERLNDAEVQNFWQLYEEIVRRRAAAGTAAQRPDGPPSRIHWFKQRRLALTFKLGQGRTSSWFECRHPHAKGTKSVKRVNACNRDNEMVRRRESQRSNDWVGKKPDGGSSPCRLTPWVRFR